MNVPASVCAYYATFLGSCACDDSFRLTRSAELSPFARCFGVYGQHLLRLPFNNPIAVGDAIKCDLRVRRKQSRSVPVDKFYRQLLTFSLSALAILGELKSDPLAELIEEQIPKDVSATLQSLGCFDGKPGSGNQAMFLAIFLIHARDWLGLNTQSKIDQWVELHVRHMNQFGFWGPARGMTHLQFQNGYHQYEIFEYLGVKLDSTNIVLSAVRSLADAEGHFAPYPGGGGCFDYDAVFLLTPAGIIPDVQTKKILVKTAGAILASQNTDGGFCESRYIRPRSMANLARSVRHVIAMRENPAALKERLHYCLTLQRPKHNRIATHWSRYSRAWGESDLWDSWFRMLALARIDQALNVPASYNWGFIDYPGIGFHPSARVSQSKG